MARIEKNQEVLLSLHKNGSLLQAYKKTRQFIPLFCKFVQPYQGYGFECFYVFQTLLQKKSEGNSLSAALTETFLERAQVFLMEVTASEDIWSWSGGSKITGSLQVGATLTLGTIVKVILFICSVIRKKRKHVV